MLLSSLHEIVASRRAGSYEERTCLRCFEGRVYDVQRGAWVACDLGTVGPGHVYLYAAFRNNVYGLAWLLNGDDVGVGGEDPTAHACLDFGQLFGGEAPE